MNKFIVAGLLAMFAVTVAQAGDLKVSGVWTRATAPGQDTAMVQLVIGSKQAGKLVAASSEASQSTELHSMVHEQGMMKMRQVESIDLPAGKPVDFAEAGYHLMLLGLKKPLKAGDEIEVVLNVRLAGGKSVKEKVVAKVKPLVDHGEHEHHHH